MKAIKIIAYFPSYREAVQFKSSVLEPIFNNVKVVKEESPIRGGDFVFLCFQWAYELVGSPYILREASTEDEYTDGSEVRYECFDTDGYDCCGQTLPLSQAIQHLRDYDSEQQGYQSTTIVSR